MVVDTKKRRASGDTAAEETVKEVAKEAEEPAKVELPDERERTFRTPGFRRMRTNWTADTARILQEVQGAVDGRVMHDFLDAYQVMYEVYDLVRTPDVDANGAIKKDKYGFTVWRKTVTGNYEEDWTRLTTKQKENLLFAITTRLFEWEQRSADAWGEAMFAKALWEERFALAFDAPVTGTVDDRRAAGNKDAAEERYFAIYQSLYSKKAEAIVRSLNLLGQRIKDSMSL